VQVIDPAGQMSGMEGLQAVPVEEDLLELRGGMRFSTAASICPGLWLNTPIDWFPSSKTSI
jgi:hypothetical protein